MNDWRIKRYLPLLGLCCLLFASCSPKSTQTSAATDLNVTKKAAAQTASSLTVRTDGSYTISEDGTFYECQPPDAASASEVNKVAIDPEYCTLIANLTGPGQLLPITAQAIIAGETFDLEVAETPRQQQLGLMFRDTLPDNRGMLFPFSQPRRASFWMRNVPVGLDMIFLYQGEVQGIAEAPPCEVDPCPTYSPGNMLIDNVIELRIGRAAELGLEKGDRVEITFLDR
ncbi:MAG: DUF192 domain-containing protein [Cyanobacteria bacterium P01_H01_bin.21]